MIIGIIYNHLKPNAQQYCAKISDWLKDKNIKVKNISYKLNKNPKVDFIISLGGDGTMLRISRLVSTWFYSGYGCKYGDFGIFNRYRYQKRF